MNIHNLVQGHLETVNGPRWHTTEPSTRPGPCMVSSRPWAPPVMTRGGPARDLRGTMISPADRLARIDALPGPCGVSTWSRSGLRPGSLETLSPAARPIDGGSAQGCPWRCKRLCSLCRCDSCQSITAPWAMSFQSVCPPQEPCLTRAQRAVRVLGSSYRSKKITGRGVLS